MKGECEILVQLKLYITLKFKYKKYLPIQHSLKPEKS